MAGRARLAPGYGCTKSPGRLQNVWLGGALAFQVARTDTSERLVAELHRSLKHRCYWGAESPTGVGTGRLPSFGETVSSRSAVATVSLYGTRVLLVPGSRRKARTAVDIAYLVARSAREATQDATGVSACGRYSRWDILLLRAGWGQMHQEELDEAGRHSVREARRFIGLAQSHDTSAWLWDNRIPLIGTDASGVEVLPPVDSTPFADHTTPRFTRSRCIAP